MTMNKKITAGAFLIAGLLLFGGARGRRPGLRFRNRGGGSGAGRCQREKSAGLSRSRCWPFPLELARWGFFGQRGLSRGADPVRGGGREVRRFHRHQARRGDADGAPRRYSRRGLAADLRGKDDDPGRPDARVLGQDGQPERPGRRQSARPHRPDRQGREGTQNRRAHAADRAASRRARVGGTGLPPLVRGRPHRRLGALGSGRSGLRAGGAESGDGGTALHRVQGFGLGGRLCGGVFAIYDRNRQCQYFQHKRRPLPRTPPSPRSTPRCRRKPRAKPTRPWPTPSPRPTQKGWTTARRDCA